MRWLRRFRTFLILRRHAIPDHEWHSVTQQLPLLASLDTREKVRLRVLTTLFIHKKSFSGVQGMTVTLSTKIVIAAQACLEVLELGIDAFEGWHEIIVYPGAFKVERDTRDENGLVHNNSNALSGESWMNGPVILSWENVERESYSLGHGHHVVLHEFAHKLDMLNGRANGMPPLHPDMSIAEWTDTLSAAYERLVKRVEHHRGSINPYGATNPAEFFAVLSEYFFTAPNVLDESYPHVYQLLKSYFRQDPLSRKAED